MYVLLRVRGRILVLFTWEERGVVASVSDAVEGIGIDCIYRHPDLSVS